MKRQVLTLAIIALSINVYAQKKSKSSDTLRIQDIEDVQLHKTGNPNKAKILSGKSNLTVM